MAAVRKFVHGGVDGVHFVVLDGGEVVGFRVGVGFLVAARRRGTVSVEGNVEIFQGRGRGNAYGDDRVDWLMVVMVVMTWRLSLACGRVEIVQILRTR